MSQISTLMHNIVATDAQLQQIANKVNNGVRLSPEDGLYLFEHAPLGWLGALANQVGSKSMVTVRISTATSISSLPTCVCSVVSFARTAACTANGKKAGS